MTPIDRLLILIMALIVLAAGLILSVPAHAMWKDEYANASQEEREWYQKRMLTDATKRRIKAEWFNYCCDHADTVEAQFRKDGKGWQYRLPGETEFKVMPQDIVQEDISTPHGKPVLFVDPTYHHFGPVCFFPGNAGV